MPIPSVSAVREVTTPEINTISPQSSGHAAEPSYGPSILPPLPPLPPDCSPLARSSSPRHHVSTSSPSPSVRRTVRGGNLSAVTTSPLTPPRPRRQYSPRLRSVSSIHPPVQWGEDTIANPSSFANDTPNHPDGEDDSFLNFFADHDFSSPSNYPSFTANLPVGEASQSDQPAVPTQQATAFSSFNSRSGAAASRPSSACDRLFAASSRSTTQLAFSTVGESQNTLSSSEDWEDQPLPQSSTGSFPDTLPPPSRLQHLVTELNYKRQHTLASDMAVNNATVESLQLADVADEDPFGDISVPRRVLSGEQEMPTIDLTGGNEVSVVLEKLKASEKDNRTKMSKFQCVICMDDASALTVTHCGHLYCAQCLHSSLHVEATKGKCPMCRAKIDMRPRSTYNTKTKGFWPLELKLMTSTRKGKRKADNIS